MISFSEVIEDLIEESLNVRKNFGILHEEVAEELVKEGNEDG